MCMCIEFVLQVLKQKNAHVSFPVGMVYHERHEMPAITISNILVTCPKSAPWNTEILQMFVHGIRPYAGRERHITRRCLERLQAYKNFGGKKLVTSQSKEY